MQTSVTRRNGLKICWRLSLRGRRKWRLEVDMSTVDRHGAGRFGDCCCPGPVRRSLIHSPVCMIRCRDSLPSGVLDYWNTRRQQEASKLPSKRLCEAVAPYRYLKFPSFFIIAYEGNRKCRLASR